MKSIEKRDKGEFLIYQAADGTIQTEVRLAEETLWLRQNQLELLFSTDRTSIVKHIKNIIKTGELKEEATCAKFAQVRQEGKRVIQREIKYYNLDMILSIGYRVNSKRGTQFRIWANRVLKDHLIKGYSLNQKKLNEEKQRFKQLQESIQLIERTIIEETNGIEDARNIVQVLAKFACGLKILDDYDHENLETLGKTARKAMVIDRNEFLEVVEAMRQDFDSEVFAKPKDQSFDSSVRQIYQSFAGEELYPSIEQKAAMLLYLVVKNHSFVDGNKRIAAALFLYFLDRNNLLFSNNGERRINQETLAAITLLIAISKPNEMDTMVKIVVTILNRSL